ncbi:Na+/H+ antiporter [Anoxybacterium hadale]|uniref:Na+/H+ antiporter n=1 Tax=Anoxybacterium hadale TaxID=3408580 RepID=A0ACD1AH20_9FIRM|nr:Na+/H+ antiporter [Clostridiales bacterium]
MSVLTIILLLMLGLLISNIVGHYIPFIPTALTQIVFGVIIASAIGYYTFEIDAEWFLLLFVAPLLYNDGRYFSREELWGMKSQIFGNAFILVILTTVLCGYVINWLIPAIPMAACLALAAILSPTDPVAVNGIAKRIRVPEKVMALVRGESLINDASGLIAFKYAIAAAATGYFSLREAIWDFSYHFLIGAAAGLLLGLLITFIRFGLRNKGINDPVFHSLLQILTPFAVFIITEDILHASGVIAVVAAGIIHSIIREHTETHMAEEQLLTENTWSIVLFVLNGFVFLLLGMNIPSAMFEILSSPDIGNWLVFGYVAIIGLTILAIRFVWSLMNGVYRYYFRKKNGAEKPEIKAILITTLAGVRGTVTMAGVLTVPAFLGNGELFPARSLIIFIAAGVILLLLILATVFLPLICKGEAMIEGTGKQTDLYRAKNKLLMSAIDKIRAETNAENEFAAAILIGEYNNSFQMNLSEQEADEHYNRKIAEARLLALNLQRKYIKSLLSSGDIDVTIFDVLTKYLDYREETLNFHSSWGTKVFLKRAIRDFSRLRGKPRRIHDTTFNDLHLIRDLQTRAMEAAVSGLKEHVEAQGQSDYIYAVILEYEKILPRFKRNNDRDHEKLEGQMEELRLKVLDAERSELHRMYEVGEISADQEKKLRRFTNYIESIVLYEHYE